MGVHGAGAIRGKFSLPATQASADLASTMLHATPRRPDALPSATGALRAAGIEPVLWGHPARRAILLAGRSARSKDGNSHA